MIGVALFRGRQVVLDPPPFSPAICTKRLPRPRPRPRLAATPVAVACVNTTAIAYCSLLAGRLSCYPTVRPVFAASPLAPGVVLVRSLF